ncbi:hypothetical protein [Amycolatopsis tolypomycina]|uniref:Peptidase inhibitor family I36 n=1 Tax=Amycolatopsis tolypomycina TaxID=208445 RepID=A0A1H4QTT6_9PSEU|nr:hypothetical protein [Amycolatopsis tolypomycina]SEC23055.1 hypothetical protein SAMN04489727_3031 [Amycolatopsis tolypomycina]
MKKMMFFVVSVLAAVLLAAPSATAESAPAGPVCISEALWLYGPNGTAMCTGAAIPSINPAFTAVSESNGSQNAWCLYSQPNYLRLVARIPAFSRADAWVTVASARPC